MKHKFGFTLIEALLSIALIGLITGVGVPVYQSFQNRNNLSIAKSIFIDSAYRAELLARSGDGDSSWGIHVTNDNITVFKGGDYSTRDTTFDEVYSLKGITVSDAQTYIFNKLTGYPVDAGTTTLTSINNETKTISINVYGTVQ